MSQLKCVISDSKSPEFQTKGAILDNFMKVHVNQKIVHPRSLLAQKKQKTTRSGVIKCSTIAQESSDSMTATDRTLSRAVSPDERCSNPAFSPSCSEPETTAALPNIKCSASRKRSDSTPRQLRNARTATKANTASGGVKPAATVSNVAYMKADMPRGGAKPAGTVSNVERLQREREAMLLGMRTGVVDAASSHRTRNGGRRSQLPTVPSDVASHRGRTKTVASSDVSVLSDKNDEAQTTSKNEQESCNELQNGKDGRKFVYLLPCFVFFVYVKLILISFLYETLFKVKCIAVCSI